VKPIWDSLDVQVSGGLNLVSHKDLGLECQEIDNFEIIGSINIPILEQEYINSIEIVERNSSINRQRNSLLIECMDDLQISPSRNEVRFLNANVPRLSYDMENVDDFEIIGRNKEEEFEVEKIDKISYQDKVIENQYDEINTRQYNTKKIKQINRGDEENEIIRYREDYKKKSNYPYSSLEEDRYKIIKQTRIYEQENMYDREDWNKYNELQQIKSIFIPGQRASQSYQEGGDNYSATGFGMGIMYKNNNNWNEKNRTQGIVNLSVIDDNKKQPWDFGMENEEDMEENRENSEEDPKDNKNLNKNLEIRKIHNDYDSDELNDINPKGLQNKGKQDEYQDYKQTQKQIKYIEQKEDEKEKKGTGKSKYTQVNYIYGHDSGREEEDIIEKNGPAKYQQTYKKKKDEGDEEDIIEKKGPAQYQQGKAIINKSIKSREDEGNEKEKKEPVIYQPSNHSYKISHQSGEEEEIEEIKERKGPGKYQTGSANYSIHSQHSGKDDEDLKEKKAMGQSISNSENYMISQQSKKDDKDTYKKEKKGQTSYKPSSINYMISQGKRKDDPKIIVNQPKAQYKNQNKSKEQVTGMMKKRPKIKSYEYLRDDNQA